MSSTPLLTLDHDGIAQLIPHAGAMCLLSRLDGWSATQIVCIATSHRDPAHPLRTASGLMSPCAIEYAAQAMALHGALIGAKIGAQIGAQTGARAGDAVRPGFLASARSVDLHRLRLDDLPGDLRIEAERQAGDDLQILYRFQVTHRGEAVAEGRAAVVLNTPLAGSARTP